MTNAPLIAVASWEDRFRLGIERTIEEQKPSSVMILFYKEYESWTRENRNRIKSVCANSNVEFSETELQFEDPATTWKTLSSLFLTPDWCGRDATVDISTMPREAIWSMFYLLEAAGARISYLYHLPEVYHAEWLSKEPGQPRLVYQLSGIAKLGQPTCLLVATGFDPERTLQLVSVFEPKITLLGMQLGEQFENTRKNIENHKKALQAHADVEFFDMDAYSEDNGYASVLGAVSPYLNGYNVVVSSLGPKPSAVALYRLAKSNPSIALAYAPSNKFNLDYSHGIGRCLRGTPMA